MIIKRCFVNRKEMFIWKFWLHSQLQLRNAQPGIISSNGSKPPLRKVQKQHGKTHRTMRLLDESNPLFSCKNSLNRVRQSLYRQAFAKQAGDLKFHVDKEWNPQTVLHHSPGILLFKTKKNLAIPICICYTCRRQKVIAFHVDKERNPPTVFPYSWGILLFFYSGKAPTRLFVVLIMPTV